MQDALLVKHRGRTLILRPADIQWISAEGDYVGINSAGRKYLLRDRISRLEREFAPGEFLRIHRSVLVNRVNVRELEPKPFGECDVILDNGVRLPMSRSRKSSVLRWLQERPFSSSTSTPILHFIAAVTFLVTMLSTPGSGQTQSVHSLLGTEEEFAGVSALTSADSAFLQFIAPDGVLLRPDPVNGKEWLQSHPSPTLMLRWRPALGVASSAGDLGFTTGPFEDWDTDDTSGSRYHGEFVTAWKRQADGQWRFVFDFGISHSEDTWQKAVPARGIEFDSPKESPVDTDGLRHSLVTAPMDPSLNLLRSHVLLLRPGSLPIADPDRASSILELESKSIARTLIFADVAASGDLAYTYGRFTQSIEAGPAKSGYYFTVWKMNPLHRWDVLWDVLGRAR